MTPSLISPFELECHREVAVLDVRAESEREAWGGIPGAFLCPESQLSFDRLRGPFDAVAPVAIACMSGRRALLAADTLRGFGYLDVHVVEGGVLAWRAAGLATCCVDTGTSTDAAPVSLTDFPRALLACFVAEISQQPLTGGANCDDVIGDVREIAQQEVADGVSRAAMRRVIDRTAMLARRLGFPLAAIAANTDHMRRLLGPATA